MRRRRSILAPLAIAGGVLVLVVLVVGGLPAGCPAALLEGTLVARDGELWVQGDEPGTDATPVRWPTGYWVREDGGQPVLVHWVVTVAQPGDRIASAAGWGSQDVATACGEIRVTPAADATPSPTDASGTAPGVDLDAPAMPFSLLPDADALHGSATGAPAVIRLPDGTFLLLRREDTEAGGVLLHSADGIDWTPVDGAVPGTGGSHVQGIAATGDAVVAFGVAGLDAFDADPVPMTTWRSADGLRWDVAAGITRPDVEAWAITSTADHVLVRGADRVLVLGDAAGRTWQTIRLPGERHDQVAGIAATSSGYVAVGYHGDDGIAWLSADAVTWGRLPTLLTGSPFDGIAAAGDRVVADASHVTVIEDGETTDEISTPVLLESADGGRTWAPSAIPIEGVGSASVIAVPGGLLVTTWGPAFEDPVATWYAPADGPWIRVALEPTGLDEHTFPMSAAGTPDHIILASATLGTGAGGDRVVLWTYDAP